MEAGGSDGGRDQRAAVRAVSQRAATLNRLRSMPLLPSRARPIAHPPALRRCVAALLARAPPELPPRPPAGARRPPSCSAPSASSCGCPRRPASSAARTASRWAGSLAVTSLQLQLASWRARELPAARGHTRARAAAQRAAGAGSTRRPAHLARPAPLTARGRRPARPAQQAWGAHKSVHKAGAGEWAFCTRRGRSRSANMPDFDWTGPLRPFKISPRRQVSWAPHAAATAAAAAAVAPPGAQAPPLEPLSQRHKAACRQPSELPSPGRRPALPQPPPPRRDAARRCRTTYPSRTGSRMASPLRRSRPGSSRWVRRRAAAAAPAAGHPAARERPSAAARRHPQRRRPALTLLAPAFCRLPLPRRSALLVGR